MTNDHSNTSNEFQHIEPLNVWALLFVGLPFFLLGCAFAVWLIGWFAIGIQMFQRMPITVLFVGVGALVVSLKVLAYGRRIVARRGVRFDREHGVVALLGGLFVPRVVETRRLTDFQRLRIRRLNENTYHLDLVGLGADALTVAEEATYMAARDLAETIGVFLHWDVEDATASAPVLLPAHVLGKSLAEQAGDVSGPDAMLQPPADMLAAVSIDSDRVVYRIPPRGGLRCLLSFVVVTVLVVGGFIGLFAVNKEKAGIVAFGVVVLIFWCIGLVTLIGETERTTVEVDRRSVLVRRRKLFLTTKDFPAASLREVRQELKTWLRLIAVGGETKFGHPDLTEAEVAWFREVILKTVRNPRGGQDASGRGKDENRG